MESPIMTECDALREEVALLTAENTRLLNELNALKQRVASENETAAKTD